MSPQEEEEFIHALLAELLHSPDASTAIPTIFNKINLPPNEYDGILHRAQVEGLIQRYASTRGRWDSIGLTMNGKTIARRHNGYKGFRGEQIDSAIVQIHKERLERDVALATIASAKATVSASKAAWVAAVFSLISIAVSIFALHKSTELDEAQERITALQRQIETLKGKIQ